MYSIREIMFYDAEKYVGLSRLFNLEMSKYAPEYADFDYDKAGELESVTEFIESMGRRKIYVITSQDKVIGFADTSLEQDNYSKIHETVIIISSIYIDEVYTRKGAGRQLVEHIINEAKKDNVTEAVYATVLDGNLRAYEFFQKLGFKPYQKGFKCYYYYYDLITQK